MTEVAVFLGLIILGVGTYQVFLTRRITLVNEGLKLANQHHVDLAEQVQFQRVRLGEYFSVVQNVAQECNGVLIAAQEVTFDNYSERTAEYQNALEAIFIECTKIMGNDGPAILDEIRRRPTTEHAKKWSEESTLQKLNL